MTMSFLSVNCRLMSATLFLCLLGTAHTVTADGRSGSAMEAKAMLQRAVEAIDADPSAALKSFTAGTNGFKDRDLYVFCSGPDGKISAHGANPDFVGENHCGFVDRAG